MKICGFQKLSLIEYPGKVSSIIFLAGCNFRCPFCYVPQLVLPKKIKKMKEIPEEYIFHYFEKNKKFIDAVVISGGEPTINEDLSVFIKRIKAMDFLVGLETNGTNTQMLKRLIEEKLVDYVEMDIKNRVEFKKYNETVGRVLTKKMFASVRKSINLLLNSNVDYEFRTTLVKEFHTKEDVLEICKSIKGAKKYYLQDFKKLNGLVGRKSFTAFDKKEVEEIVAEGKKFVNIKYRK